MTDSPAALPPMNEISYLNAERNDDTICVKVSHTETSDRIHE
jgi:hypothetical protein